MDYNDLTSKPEINGVEVSGDLTLEDYGLQSMTDEEVQEIMLEVFGYTL